VPQVQGIHSGFTGDEPMRGLHALCVNFTRPPRAIAAKTAQNPLAWFLLNNLD
jgi:hypothetical protein